MRGFAGWRSVFRAAGVWVALAWGGGVVLGAQTLARPGWAGSGLTVSEWWRNAVLFEVLPPASAAAAGALADLLGELDDLQTLGADALLLRGVDRGSAGSDGRVAEPYGTTEQFDALLQAASQRRIRLLVELPAALDGDALRGAARFWLSRGVSGLPLGEATGAGGVAGAAGGRAQAQAAVLREVLRGYAGGRVLVVSSAAAGLAGGGPEVVLVPIRGFASGAVDVAAVRESLQMARGAAGGGRRGGSASEIDAGAPPVSGAAAEARAAVLLMVTGGVVLRAGEIGAGPGTQAVEAAKVQRERDAAEVARATSPAGISNARRAIAARAAAEPPRFAGDAAFRWTERMVGLHRGNPAMLLGSQELLDHDRDGVVVSVWRGRAGQVLCEVVNLRDAPAEISLAGELHERGSFLRAVARTDQGMGAMPLARVKLPPFGVFLGELGR